MGKEQKSKEQKNEIKEFSAGVIVFSEKSGRRKYLVLHYPSGHFDFPKGHLETGETELQAAIRELTEETGISQVNILNGYEHYIHYGFYKKEGYINKKVTFFLGEVPNEEVQISHEHQGYLWLEYDQALAKITFENAKSLLKSAEQFLKQNHENKL